MLTRQMYAGEKEGITTPPLVFQAVINPFYLAMRKHGGIRHILGAVEAVSHGEGYTATAGNGVCLGTLVPGRSRSTAIHRLFVYYCHPRARLA